MDSVDSIDNDINVDIGEFEEMPLTAAQVTEIMEEAWLNEKFAPEILPHKSRIVECLLGQITYMEENLHNLSNTDFQKSLHQMELDRLRFIITSYLRTRLEKIETYVDTILNQEDQRSQQDQESYLTDDELQFAKAYKESIGQHFEEILRFWPGITPEQWQNEMILPNMHSFVFVKSKAEVEGVLIDDAEDEDAIVDLQIGSQIIISYKSVANLVKNDQVYLI